MSKRDYYEILEVGKNSSKEEIKKAYRKMAIKYHPDKNSGDKIAEEKFKEAAEAYDVLSNPEKKERYDQYGHAGVGSSGGFSNVDAEDIFSRFGDIFGDVFGSSGFGGFSSSGGGFQRQRVAKGSNIRIKVKLSLEEVVSGVQKKIKIKRKEHAEGVTTESCSHCRGTGQMKTVQNTMLGQMQTVVACSYCGGDGKVIKSKPSNSDHQGLVLKDSLLTLDIPSGVEEGMQISFRGKGNAGPKGGPNGDLIVVVEEIDHEFLKREGNNIHYEHIISISDAILGTSIEVPTIGNKSSVKIPEGIQSGKIFRLKGKGINDINNRGAGDFLIHIKVWIPQKINKEEKELIKKLDESKNFKPNKSCDSHPGFFEKVKEMFS